MRRAQMIARHDINAIEQYFCPSCTRERKTHLLVWHLAFVTVCPIHNCRLVSRCETCFHRLNLGSVLEGICAGCGKSIHPLAPNRSEEHTSELQSLMRISYAVFCLKKKIKHTPSYL